MKRILPFVIAIIASFSSTEVIATSCPEIQSGSFRIITDNESTGLRRVSFDFINPTNGAKSIRVQIFDGTTLRYDLCINAGGQEGIRRNYTSPQFTNLNLGQLLVEITPFTGGSCSGSSCAPKTSSLAGAPLPVQFSQFSLARNGRSVLVNWETLTEINNSGFHVERNTNGQWESVGFVKTKSADGNSSERLQYQFSDNNNFSGISQYRIRQTDVDGKIKYSDVRAIRGEEATPKTVVFPNPSPNGTISVIFGETSQKDVVLNDMSGRVIRQWSAFSGNSLQLNNLVPGMYTLRSVDRATNDVQVQKLVVSAR